MGADSLSGVDIFPKGVSRDDILFYNITTSDNLARTVLCPCGEMLQPESDKLFVCKCGRWYEWATADGDDIESPFLKEEWRGGLLATIVVTMIVVALYLVTWIWRKWTNLT